MNPSGELVLNDKNTEVKLAPGLYDENNKLITSLDNLLSMEYQTITYYVYDYEEEVEVKMTSAILNVDENGLLTTPTDDAGVESFSQNYLVGKLVIDDSVTSIGNGAFAYCSSLATINYTGTQAQWNAISKGSKWDSGTPSNKVINYNYAG